LAIFAKLGLLEAALACRLVLTPDCFDLLCEEASVFFLVNMWATDDGCSLCLADWGGLAIVIAFTGLEGMGDCFREFVWDCCGSIGFLLTEKCF